MLSTLGRKGKREVEVGIYQISVKNQFWGSYTLIVAPTGVKFGTETHSITVPAVSDSARVYTE